MAEGHLTTALVAGGCFWCVEADAEKMLAVVDAESGYAGGETEHPTYDDYADGGHREVVRITYDPSKTSYRDLLRYFITKIDPTDAEGSFADRGTHYSPAIYYDTEEEKHIAEEVVREFDASGVYDKPLAVEVLPRPRFWPAEEYHQNYAEKNPEHYERYRVGSGREAFIKAHETKDV